jgi:hypothetical protein
LTPLVCAFCGSPLRSADCVWVRLSDGADFVCCPTACPPMLAAVEARRSALAAQRLQLALPLSVA